MLESVVSKPLPPPGGGGGLGVFHSHNASGLGRATGGGVTESPLQKMSKSQQQHQLAQSQRRRKRKRRHGDGGSTYNNGGNITKSGGNHRRRRRIGAPRDDVATPSLAQLARANQAKTALYYPSPSPGPHPFFRSEASTPASVPRAPFNTTSFIMRSNVHGIHAPLASPATPSTWTKTTPRDMYGREWSEDLGEDARGLDIDSRGSMLGKIMKLPIADDDRSGESESDDRSNSNDNHSGGDDDAVLGFELVSVDKTTEQARKIELLEEENLTLRERVYLLEKYVRDLKSRVLEIALPEPAVIDDAKDSDVP